VPQPRERSDDLARDVLHARDVARR
jgi:hypothetical protein